MKKAFWFALCALLSMIGLAVSGCTSAPAPSPSPAAAPATPDPATKAKMDAIQNSDVPPEAKSMMMGAAARDAQPR